MANENFANENFVFCNSEKKKCNYTKLLVTQIVRKKIVVKNTF